jgi:hypothetical protein
MDRKAPKHFQGQDLLLQIRAALQVYFLRCFVLDFKILNLETSRTSGQTIIFTLELLLGVNDWIPGGGAVLFGFWPILYIPARGLTFIPSQLSWCRGAAVLTK